LLVSEFGLTQQYRGGKIVALRQARSGRQNVHSSE
jgi:hypothetical protein